MANLVQNQEKFLKPLFEPAEKAGSLKMGKEPNLVDAKLSLDSEVNLNNAVESGDQLVSPENDGKVNTKITTSQNIHEVSGAEPISQSLGEKTVLQHLHGDKKVSDPAVLLEQVLNLSEQSKTDSAYKV